VLLQLLVMTLRAKQQQQQQQQQLLLHPGALQSSHALAGPPSSGHLP
jgi:Tfp pilus assembly protein PilV